MSNQKKTNICGGKLMPAVNVSDDMHMTMSGLRQPKFQINPLVFKKTKEEKLAVKKAKTKYSPGTVYIQKSNSVGKLVIHVENIEHKKDFKTTYTYHDVRKEDIRDYEKIIEHKKLKIKKSYFNLTKVSFN